MSKSFKDSLYDFIMGTSEGKIRENKLSLNSSFVKYYIDPENSDQTLRIVNKAVHSAHWLEEGHFYESEILANSIRIGEEVRKLQGYMDRKEGYKGVDLNSDVLKMVLSDFLNTIPHYMFYAFSEDTDQLFERVKNTPDDILPYVIEERYVKLVEYTEQDQLEPSLGLAVRILEYDLLIHKQGGPRLEEAKAEVAVFAKRFSEAVMTSHVDQYDDIQEKEATFEGESIVVEDPLVRDVLDGRWQSSDETDKSNGEAVKSEPPQGPEDETILIDRKDIDRHEE